MAEKLGLGNIGLVGVDSVENNTDQASIETAQPLEKKAKPWKDVYSSPKFQALTAEQKDKAQHQYFETVVKPKLDIEKIAGARAQFNSFATSLKPAEKRAGDYLKEFGRGALGAVSDVAGKAFGLANAPLAFYYGSLEARSLNPEEFDKMNPIQRDMVTLGSGLESAYRSIMKKDDWGTMFGEYWKSTTGESIEDSLPTSLKWAAPTLEALANIAGDPVIGVGVLKNISKFKLSNEFIGKLPKDMVDDLAKLQNLDVAEKKAFQGKLTELLNRRADYMKWWEEAAGKIDGVEQARETLRGGGQLALPAGGQFTMRETAEVASEFSPQLAAQIKAARQLALPNRAGEFVTKSTEEIASSFSPQLAAQAKQASTIALPPTPTEAKLVGKSSIPLEQNIYDAARKLEILQRRQDVFEPRHYQEIARLEKSIKELAKKDVPLKLAELSGRKEQYELLKRAGANTDVKIIDNIVNDGIKQKLGTAEGLLSRAAKVARLDDPKAINHSTELRQAADKLQEEAFTTARRFLSLDDPRVNRAIEQQLGKKFVYDNGVTVRSAGGLLGGFETDEEGNITYDVKKGMLFAAAAVGAGSVVGLVGKKDFSKIIAKYPGWTRVSSMIAEKPGTFRTIMNYMPGLLSRLNVSLIDRFSKISDYSRETYDAALSYRGYKDVAAQKFEKLVEGLAGVRKDEKVFSDYVTAHRAMDRAGRGLKNPSGVTLSEASAAIKDLEAFQLSNGKDPAKLRAALGNFQKWTKEEILDDLARSGIISKEGYKAILSKNQWYAAFDVVENMPASLESIPILKSSEYFSPANQQVIKTMRGTEKLIDDPIKATIRKFSNTQALIAKNNVIRILVDDPNSGKFLRHVAMSTEEMVIMRKQGLNPIAHNAWDNTKFDMLSCFVNGRVKRFLAPKELADAMKQMSPMQVNRHVAALNDVFRKSATTVYLPFTISNAFRDAMMAYTTAPAFSAMGIGKFAAKWARGLAEGVKFEFLGKSDLATEYIANGGGFGYVGNLRNAKIAKELLFQRGIVGVVSDIITSPIKLIEKISAAVELAPRLGTFSRAMDIGLSARDAAVMARRATIDFNRGGTFTKVANQWIPFLNARVQSKVTLASALKNRPGATLAKTFTAVVPPALGFYAWNRMYYSKEYDDIPREVRNNYFVGIIGMVRDERSGKKVPQYLAIPKGDVGQLAFNPIEFALDKEFSKYPEKVQKFLVSYLAQYSPISVEREGKIAMDRMAGDLLPPIAKGAIENWANLRLWTGRNIVPHYDRLNKPPELQYNNMTPESYKWLGKKLDVSPSMIQNFAQNILAGYGREGLSPEAMLRGLTGRLVKTRSDYVEDMAFSSLKDIEQGYFYTRAFAEEFVKNGHAEKANKLMSEWNSKLDSRVREFNKEYKKHGLSDKGGIIKSYSFTGEKRKKLFEKGQEEKAGKLNALEKRLRGER